MSADAAPVAVGGIVRGRVQGVSFRYSMARTARDLGLTGWVRNEPDNSVAFHAQGPAPAVAALLEWSQRGPALARVDAVEAAPCDPGQFASFDILR